MSLVYVSNVYLRSSHLFVLSYMPRVEFVMLIIIVRIFKWILSRIIFVLENKNNFTLLGYTLVEGLLCFLLCQNISYSLTIINPHQVFIIETFRTENKNTVFSPTSYFMNYNFILHNLKDTSINNFPENENLFCKSVCIFLSALEDKWRGSSTATPPHGKSSQKGSTDKRWRRPVCLNLRVPSDRRENIAVPMLVWF